MDQTAKTVGSTSLSNNERLGRIIALATARRLECGHQVRRKGDLVSPEFVVAYADVIFSADFAGVSRIMSGVGR
jgi:hypothetical protein